SRILSVLDEPVEVFGRQVVVSASIGIALDTPGINVDQLLRNADLAMYSAKRHDRARYEVFRDEMHVAAVERLEVESDLRGAIERRELTIDYQPIARVPTGSIVGVEALVRWEHP